MSGRKQAVPAKLSKLERRFSSWRRTRRLGAAIPSSLWQAATECGLEFGVNQTAKRLNLDYYSLRKRVEKIDPSASTDEAQFVELSPLPVMSECTIELEDGSGAMLRVRVKGSQLPDYVALARSFWSGE